MKTFYKIALVFSLACSAFGLRADENAQPKATTRLEIYTNTEKGYSLEYPSDWKKSDVPQLDLVLFAPSKENNENPHASANIVSEKVGGSITLEQFYSESAANLKSALKDVQVEKSGSSALSGVPSKWVLYTHVLQGVKFRVMQYFVVAEETIFLITFSSSAQDFDYYRPDFERIANSFKITPPAELKSSIVPSNSRSTTPNAPTIKPNILNPTK